MKINLIFSIVIILTVLKSQTISEWTTIETDGNVYDLQLRDNILYFIVYSGSGSKFMSYDCAEPSNPVALDSIITNGFIVHFTLADSIAYLAMADSEFGIRALSINDPSNITEINFYEGTETNDLFYEDGQLYAADGGGLKVFDVSVPDTIIMDWYYSTNQYGDGYKVFVDENSVYISAYTYGVFIIDRTVHTLSSVIQVPSLLSGLFAYRSSLYLSNNDLGFVSYDISDPSNPTFLDSIIGENSPIFSGQIYVDSETSYFADGSYGLKIIDITNPSYLELKDSYIMDNSVAYCVEKKDSVIFLGCENELKILHISDLSIESNMGMYPSSYNILGAYPNPFNPQINIDYSIEYQSNVTAYIVDITGRKLETILSSTMVPGHYSVSWIPTGFSSGMYFIFFDDGKNTVQIKTIYLK